MSIADTFDRLGETELAARAGSLYRLDARTACEALATLLRHLFDMTRADDGTTPD